MWSQNPAEQTEFGSKRILQMMFTKLHLSPHTDESSRRSAGRERNKTLAVSMIKTLHFLLQDCAEEEMVFTLRHLFVCIKSLNNNLLESAKRNDQHVDITLDLRSSQ